MIFDTLWTSILILDDKYNSLKCLVNNTKFKQETCGHDWWAEVIANQTVNVLYSIF